MKNKIFASLCAMTISLFGCSSQDVPQAHKGRMFDKTGIAAFYFGGKGFEGPVLNPGTYYTAIYPEVRMVDCSQKTVKESLKSLTKDGVQFSLDVYIRFSAKCDNDQTVIKLLNTLSPDKNVAKLPSENVDEKAQALPYPDLTISTSQIYFNYVRPAIGEAVRESVSNTIANEVNSKREEIFSKMKISFNQLLSKQEPQLVSVYDVNLSNLDFPDEMDKANTERAVQAVLKDKAIAEREKVTAEIETAKMKKALAESEAANEAVKIDAVGASLRRNPDYVQLEMMRVASEKGNMILMQPGQNVFLQAGKK